MVYKLVKKNSSCNYLFYILLFLIAAWGLSVLYPPIEKFKLGGEDSKELICSKKCCSTTWRSPVEIKDNRINDKDIGTKYTSSNINCNDGIRDTGCICVPM